MKAEQTNNYVCPFCGSENYEHMGKEYEPEAYHCHECDNWFNEGDVIYDKNGNVLHIGDKVKWYDPEVEYRDLSRVWTIDNMHPDFVKMSDEYGECEAPYNEVEKIVN